MSERVSHSDFLHLFFFMAPVPTELYTLSLHDALPICLRGHAAVTQPPATWRAWVRPARGFADRSEEHTSELQSRVDLVCRLLLEKKNRPPNAINHLTLEVSAESAIAGV